MGSKPVVVLRAGNKRGHAEAVEMVEDGPSEDCRIDLFDNTVLGVVPESDHQIPLNAPDAVVAATNAVIESVNTGRSSPPAPPNSLEAGITCYVLAPRCANRAENESGAPPRPCQQSRAGFLSSSGGYWRLTGITISEARS